MLAMKPSTQIKPISYLKTHTAEVIRKLDEHREALIITQNGEAKAVMQDVQSYERTQETLALLKILALGTRQIEAGDVQPATAVIKQIRARRGER
jgi:prevent-host-death family protein